MGIFLHSADSVRSMMISNVFCIGQRMQLYTLY